MSRDRSPSRYHHRLQPYYNSKPQSTSEGWYLKEYDAIKAGTIDGLGQFANDRGTLKANRTTYFPPKPSDKITSNPLTTLFVGRLNPETTEETLKDVFKEYGEIIKVVIARNFGHSRGYSFIEFAQGKDCTSAYENSGKLMIDGQLVIVDYERSRVMIGWKPRRLGGGFSGYKESGQLRFGAKNRPFKITRNVKDSRIPIGQYSAECWRNHLIPPKTRTSSKYATTSRDRHFIESEKRRKDVSPYSDKKITLDNVSLLDNKKRNLSYIDDRNTFDKEIPRSKSNSSSKLSKRNQYIIKSAYDSFDNNKDQTRKDAYIDTRDRRSNSKPIDNDFTSERYHHKTSYESKSHRYDHLKHHDDKRRSSYHSNNQRNSSDRSYRSGRDTERRRSRERDSLRDRS